MIDKFIPQGSFLIARKAFESELWRNKPDSWWKIWTYILGSVQYENYKELKRGEGYFNFRELVRMKALGKGVTYGMVDKFMRYAKQSNMLTTRKSTHGVVVLVCNYSLFQTMSNYKVERVVDDSRDLKSKPSRNEVDNINKNDKNEKNDNKYNSSSKSFSSEEPITDKTDKENDASVGNHEDNLGPLTDIELWELASEFEISLGDVKSKYSDLIEMIRSGEFQAKYKSARSTKTTLKNWCKRSIAYGHFQKLNSAGLKDLADRSPLRVAERMKVAALAERNGLL